MEYGTNQMSNHHKIWENGKEPSKRPDKGRKKPQATRQAKRRAKALLKKLTDWSFAIYSSCLPPLTSLLISISQKPRVCVPMIVRLFFMCWIVKNTIKRTKRMPAWLSNTLHDTTWGISSMAKENPLIGCFPKQVTSVSISGHKIKILQYELSAIYRWRRILLSKK